MRTYSTSTDTPASVVPVKKYSNADLQKSQIINENQGKAGVYRLVNLVNGKTYIGSSVNLAKRLKRYFTFSFISNKKKITC